MSQPKTFIARWKSVSLPNKLTVICTVVIAAATVWYAVTAHYQLDAMQEQLGRTTQALRDTEHSSAIATHQTWKAIENINWLAAQADVTAKQGKQAMADTERRSLAALNTSKLEWELDQRPWVSADLTISVPPYLEGNILKTNVGLKIKNSGHSPAMDVKYVAVFSNKNLNAVLGDGDSGMEACGMLANKHWVSETIFPNGEVSQFPDQELRVDLTKGTFFMNRFYFPVLIACADYRFAFSPARHRTVYYGQIRYHGPSAGIAWNFAVEKSATGSMMNAPSNSTPLFAVVKTEGN